MNNELPEPWASVLGPKGIHSYRDFAARTDVAPGTVHRLVVGKGTPRQETISKIADALFDGDRDQVWALRGVDVKDHGDWELPAEASLLTEDQRSAILAVVRAMLPVELRRDVTDDDRDSAPIDAEVKLTSPVADAAEAVGAAMRTKREAGKKRQVNPVKTHNKSRSSGLDS